MNKLHFDSDYMECAHEKILSRLSEVNYEHLSGYGTDKYTLMAKDKIRKLINNENADIYFLVGGTQTNQVMIDTLLEPYQGVISASTGHISVHEAGAIEFTGHKVITIPSDNGKLDTKEITKFCEYFYEDANREHMVQPGMIYFSYPTEFGLIYTKEELLELRRICDKYSLKLYCDGARLGYGLVCPDCDITIEDLANICDAFYIGGTKVGALFGEAVVFSRIPAPSHFVSRIKQHGALLAKGFLTGIQFDTLFTDNLYFDISKNAIECAFKLRKAIIEKGYKRYLHSHTNQIFLVLNNEQYEELSKKVSTSYWDRLNDNEVVVRIATSWATKMEDVDTFISYL